ncbi:hypothetical protein S7335_2646 [Synechococcus sp. PCC 7335]|uniref:hypothetical protein n=1 Tax=Synechococcus sp. (strain ATCC 29403 / PCC 7335) TaxID=91464 RepID=UPI00017EB46C|nr:hypothetical protein [Synechococcus sp. PCC 7335]EDX84947.1 hypothetical protein S7335_2646 [Synechococcus sp. PCC 7335]
MKLSKLKQKVYTTAQVGTTRQLKVQYPAIKALDMRYKKSWESALSLVQTALSVDFEPNDSKNQSTHPAQIDSAKESLIFQDWLSDPPDEYKDLFAEADAALTSFGEKLSKTKQLTKTAKAMVASLDEFAEATVEEAQQLASAD